MHGMSTKYDIDGVSPESVLLTSIFLCGIQRVYPDGDVVDRDALFPSNKHQIFSMFVYIGNV